MPESEHTHAGSVRAVQYLRMSTDHQRYSLESQAAVIAEYAAAHGYQIIGTYADPGKSGLSLKGRSALQGLLRDALGPARAFDMVLVLDVSRWGRFQDLDQAAHYEFLCRQAGIRIVYCAEPFEDTDTITSAVLKHLKRAMAAEYSRELSDKLSRAHLQQARRGFRQGGQLIYGFRRQLVDHQGKPRLTLESGQTKALGTDRVVVVAGPPEEQAVIRRIFHWYVKRRLCLSEIARKLRAQGIPSKQAGPWTGATVRNILVSELCIGNMTYNHTTSKLQAQMQKNPEHLWVRVKVMEPLVSKKLFQQAQGRLAKPQQLSGPEMLESLRRLLKQEGYLSTAVLQASKSLPGVESFRRHFGGLLNCYDLIGYRSKLRCSRLTDDELLEGLRQLHARQGFVSNRTIATDPDLPSPNHIARRFGSLLNAYERAGLPQSSKSELTLAGNTRRREQERLSSGPDQTGAPSRFSPEALIARLRDLLARHGYLSARLINADPDTPSTTAFMNRFGSLLRAYEIAGWPKTLHQLNTERRQRLRIRKA